MQTPVIKHTIFSLLNGTEFHSRVIVLCRFVSLLTLYRCHTSYCNCNLFIYL